MKSSNSICWWLQGKRLGLASASPRRLALLRQVGLDPLVQAMDLDERQHPGEPPQAYVERMAISKARSGALMEVDLVLGADTVVVLDDTVLGKPGDPQEAQQMLARLSGRQHLVLTAVAVYQPATNHCRSLVVPTQVWIKSLSPADIAAYVATGDPLDKAGSYGIQGVGAFLVASVTGSCSGVAGLPVCETLDLLREFT